MAYEAAKYAKEAYGIEPEIMFVSSCYAPDDYSAPALSSLDDEDLLNVIKDAGYVTQELLDNPFMFEYFAPIARKDFYIQENYKNEATQKLNTPIVAMYGNKDTALENKDAIHNFSNYEWHPYFPIKILHWKIRMPFIIGKIIRPAILR